jgi:hypothetical protein
MKSFRYMLSLNFLQKSGQLLLKWEKLSQRTPRYVQRISRMMILSVSLVYGTYLPAWLRDHICYISLRFYRSAGEETKTQARSCPFSENTAKIYRQGFYLSSEEATRKKAGENFEAIIRLLSAFGK